MNRPQKLCSQGNGNRIRPPFVSRRVNEGEYREGLVVRIVVLVATVMLGATALVNPAAHATNWYGNTFYSDVCPFNGNMTDNKDVYFSYIDPSTTMRDAANWTRTNLMNGTSLDTFSVAEPTAQTDVVMRDLYYTDWCEDTLGVQWTTNGITGLHGMAACYSITGGGRCDQQVVRISNFWFDARDLAGDRWIVCHELGHAIGLVHRDTGQGCMLNTGAVGLQSYTAHDLLHFNGTW